MLQRNENLGIAYIPGTFPTGDLLAAIVDLLGQEYADQRGWSRVKINAIYSAYVDGVKAGKGIYQAGNIEIVPWVAKASGFNEGDTRLVLYTLQGLVNKGKIDSKWLRSPSPGKVIEVASALYKAPGQTAAALPAIAKGLKTIGILVLLVVGLYYGNKIFQTVKKRGKYA